MDIDLGLEGDGKCIGIIESSDEGDCDGIFVLMIHFGTEFYF